MKTKSVISAMITIVMLGTLLASVTTLVNAANCDDTYFQVSLNAQYDITEAFTPMRIKENSTSVYLKTGEIIAGAFLAYPWAGQENAVTGEAELVKMSYVADGSDNLGNTPNKVCRLRNMINEDGYDYAAIQFTLWTSNIGSSYVAWSPDSTYWS